MVLIGSVSWTCRWCWAIVEKPVSVFRIHLNYGLGMGLSLIGISSVDILVSRAAVFQVLSLIFQVKRRPQTPSFVVRCTAFFLVLFMLSLFGKNFFSSYVLTALKSIFGAFIATITNTWRMLVSISYRFTVSQGPFSNETKSNLSNLYKRVYVDKWTAGSTILRAGCFAYQLICNWNSNLNVLLYSLE